MSAPAASASGGGAGKLAAQKQLNDKKRRALDAAAGDDDVDEDGQRAPPSNAKRPRGDEGASSGGDPSSVQLGQNKRIEVRSFKGMVLIDIREMYIVRTTRTNSGGMHRGAWDCCRPSAAVNHLTSAGLLTHASIRFLMLSNDCSWVRTRRPARRSRARRASRSSPISGPRWSRTLTKSTRPFRRCKNKACTTTIVNLKFIF